MEVKENCLVMAAEKLRMVIFSQMLFPRCWRCSNHCLRAHTWKTPTTKENPDNGPRLLSLKLELSLQPTWIKIPGSAPFPPCAPPYHPTCSIASQWLPGNYHYHHYHHLPNGLSTYFVANMLSCSVCLFHFSSSIWGETWSGVELEIWMVIFSQMLFPRCWWCSNHCLRLHTCLKLPFSFMSPLFLCSVTLQKIRNSFVALAKDEFQNELPTVTQTSLSCFSRWTF